MLAFALPVLLLFCVGCQDRIPAAGEARSGASDIAESGEPLGLALDASERLRVAVEFSTTARTLFSILGRSGQYDFERMFRFDYASYPGIEPIQQEALKLILPSFREQKQRVISVFVNRDEQGERQPEAVEGFLKAVEHIEHSAEKMIARGIMDRVHPLYVDRLDRNLITLSGAADSASKADALGKAFVVLNGYLDQLDQARGRSCLVLQCTLYGVMAPLDVAARAALLASTARAMSIEPAVLSWLQAYDLDESDRDVLRRSLSVGLSAVEFEVQHHVALIFGADEAERATHIAYHRPFWADTAVGLARILLTQYELIAVSRD